jgi:hypothetical protein
MDMDLVATSHGAMTMAVVETGHVLSSSHRGDANVLKERVMHFLHSLMIVALVMSVRWSCALVTPKCPAYGLGRRHVSRILFAPGLCTSVRRRGCLNARGPALYFRANIHVHHTHLPLSCPLLALHAASSSRRNPLACPHSWYQIQPWIGLLHWFAEGYFRTPDARESRV